MGQFEGADPEVLDRLADGFQQSASLLDGAVEQVTTLVDHAYWQAHTGDEFRREWHGSLVPRLRSAADGLRDASTTLQRNASEQRAASGAGGSGAGFMAGSAAALLGWLDVASRNVGVPGTLGTWDRLLHMPGVHSGPAVRVDELERVDGAGLGKMLLKDVPAPFTLAVTGLDVSVDAVKTSQDVSQHHYLDAAETTMDGTSAALKATPNPVAYAAGAAVGIWGYVLQDARQVDWAHLPSMSDIKMYGWSSLQEATCEALDQAWKAIF